MRYIKLFEEMNNDDVYVVVSDDNESYSTSNDGSYADIVTGDEEWYISMIESEVNGHGTMLMNKIIEDAKEKGVKRIRLTTTELSGEGFFDKFGFKQIEDGKNDDEKYGMEFDMILYL